MDRWGYKWKGGWLKEYVDGRVGRWMDELINGKSRK